MHHPTYEVEFVADGDQVRFQDLPAGEVKQLLARRTDEASPFLIGWGDGSTSFGDLYLWTKGERAFIELQEHREHNPVDPENEDDSEKPHITFADGWTVPYRETVPAAKAHDAVVFWLMTGQKDPRLIWD